jgi:DNA-binding response OmpR family regulator
MDGFDSCLRIRETELNRTTPVVFVTCHSDFKARSQSAISGGSDLTGKPFLSAEIKVKALTFVLRGRLQKSRIAQSEINLPREAAAKPCELVAA